jgi:hypothetical protein
MSNFAGGSVYSMVQAISSGAVLVTEKTIKRLTMSELQNLGAELDRQLRFTRTEQPSLDDIPAIQVRQRTILKLTGTLTILRGHEQRRKRRGLWRHGDGEGTG